MLAFSFLLLFSLSFFLCHDCKSHYSWLSGVLSHPLIINVLIFSCFYRIYLFSPLSWALHAITHPFYTSTLPHLYSRSTPTWTSTKAEGNSLDLKIRMSLSLCSCRVASPTAAPCYGWVLSVCLIWGPSTHSQHTLPTHTTNTFQRTLRSSYHFYSPVLLLSLSPSETIWPSSFAVDSQQREWGSEPSSNKVPSPITQLLSLNTWLLHHILNTLLQYNCKKLIHKHTCEHTFKATPGAIDHNKSTILLTAPLPQQPLFKAEIVLFW